MTRLYHAKPLKVGMDLHLDEKASHYLSRVLRALPNDKLSIFNGEGGEYEGVITNINKKEVIVRLTQFFQKEVESPINISLAQGIARGEKMDFIIQKAVELGVKEIIPLMTARSNVKLNAEREEKRLAHWLGVAASACEQCGRNRLPKITAPLPYEVWLKEAKADHAFVLSPHLQTKLQTFSLPPSGNILLLIGPEGGLSEEEIKAALEKQFLPLNLGPRILRTETAPLAAISILQYHFGDMGKAFDTVY